MMLRMMMPREDDDAKGDDVAEEGPSQDGDPQLV